MRLAGAVLVSIASLLALLPTASVAQSDAAKQGPAPLPKPAAAPAAQAPGKARVQVPMDQALLLARTTLLTLNDANRSGNYTVLRDLGSPEFQARNTAADLGLVFAEMRKSNLSLFSVLLLTPQLTSAPELDNEGRLRVAGFIPMRPQQVKFDLVYEQSGGQWKLLNLGISTAQEQPKTSDQPPVATQQNAAQPQVSETKAQTKQNRQAPKPPPAPGPWPTAPPAQDNERR